MSKFVKKRDVSMTKKTPSLINRLVSSMIMLENCDKCRSILPKVDGDVFKCPKDVQFTLKVE